MIEPVRRGREPPDPPIPRPRPLVMIEPVRRGREPLPDPDPDPDPGLILLSSAQV
jgi:hypothetical protein